MQVLIYCERGKTDLKNKGKRYIIIFSEKKETGIDKIKIRHNKNNKFFFTKNKDCNKPLINTQ